MSPRASTAAARAHARHVHAGVATPPRVPRRVSGPTRAAGRPGARVAAGALPPLALPRSGRPGAGALLRWVLDRLCRLPSCRAVDRLVGGRAWIAVIAVGLLGLVAMQVHMLETKRAIGRSVEAAAGLERDNAALRLEVSRLGASARLESVAAAQGLVMPPAGSVRYLGVRAGGFDARRAAEVVRPPRPVTPGELRASGAGSASATTGGPAYSPATQAGGDSQAAAAPQAVTGTQAAAAQAAPAPQPPDGAPAPAGTVPAPASASAEPELTPAAVATAGPEG
jgi:hypothetical protein